MKKTLNDIFSEWDSGNGIFSNLSGMPWSDENISAALDLEYHGNVSGEKLISPLLYKLAEKEDENIIAKAAAIIKAVNLQRWQKLYATLSFQYDPIENYRMSEIMTDDETVHSFGHTDTRTDNLTELRTDNLQSQRTDNLQSQRTDNLEDERTDNLTQSIENNVFGFNSSSEVPSGTSETRNTGTETTTHEGTQTTAETGTQTVADTGTQNTANTGTQIHAETGTNTDTRNYNLTRSGNIGVTTSQQMIQSERELWLWSFFRDVVFPDVDKVLTLAIY